MGNRKRYISHMTAF